MPEGKAELLPAPWLTDFLVEEWRAQALSQTTALLMGADFRDNSQVSLTYRAACLPLLTSKLQSQLAPQGRGLPVIEAITISADARPTPGHQEKIALTAEFPEGRAQLQLLALDSSGLQTSSLKLALRFFAAGSPIPSSAGASFKGAPQDLGVTWTAPISITFVADYLRLSGDDNPLHWDEVSSVALGLAGCVVPGILLLSLAEECLAQHWPDRTLVSLSARLLKPVYVGSRVGLVPRQRDLGASYSRDQARLFWICEDGTIAIIADAVLR